MNMNQVTFEAIGGGLSQCDKILMVLSDAARDPMAIDWVSLPNLVKACGGYAVHSRVADLRKKGYGIEQTSIRRSGKVHSFYRLISTPL